MGDGVLSKNKLLGPAASDHGADIKIGNTGSNLPKNSRGQAKFQQNQSMWDQHQSSKNRGIDGYQHGADPSDS